MVRVQPDKHTAFEAYHPSVPACYLLITLALAMSAFHPVLVGIALVAALAFGCAVRGWRATVGALRWQLPLVVLIAVVNPLFSASGSTELLRLGARAVYAESLVYGCVAGALFVASVLWFQVAAQLLRFDEVMALAGNAAPTVALMVSMSMRLIPRFVRQGRAIAHAQEVVGRWLPAPAGVGRAARGVRARLRTSSVLMGWGMEDSLETADAMRARGWGASVRRTTYTRFHVTAADVRALAGLVVGGTCCAVLAWAACAQFSFYPVLTPLVPWWGYIPYAAWMLLPTALHIYETRRYA